MRAYSLDLRERVLAAIERGTELADVASTFQVSQPTIKRWIRRRAAGLPLAGGTGPGRPTAIAAEQLPALRAQLERQPDATLAEHLASWNAHHSSISQSALVRAIRRTGWTRKKRLCAPVSKMPLPEPRSVSGS
jgi:transposase